MNQECTFACIVYKGCVYNSPNWVTGKYPGVTWKPSQVYYTDFNNCKYVPSRIFLSPLLKRCIFPAWKKCFAPGKIGSSEQCIHFYFKSLKNVSHGSFEPDTMRVDNLIIQLFNHCTIMYHFYNFLSLEFKPWMVIQSCFAIGVVRILMQQVGKKGKKIAEK